MSAHDIAVAALADAFKQSAHWGSTHSIPVDRYIIGEATVVLDAILDAVDEHKLAAWEQGYGEGLKVCKHGRRE